MTKKKRSRCIVHEFNNYFGTGTLADWQRLCHDVGLSEDVSSITKCRKALSKVHVNIHDLVDAVQQGRTPRRFGNPQQLAEYTFRTGRFYPKKYVKEMGPVKVLLRHIL